MCSSSSAVDPPFWKHGRRWSPPTRHVAVRVDLAAKGSANFATCSLRGPRVSVAAPLGKCNVPIALPLQNDCVPGIARALNVHVHDSCFSELLCSVDLCVRSARIRFFASWTSLATGLVVLVIPRRHDAEELLGDGIHNDAAPETYCSTKKSK